LNGKSVFWIGHVALISLVSIGIAPAGAATKARAKTSRSSTAAKTPSRGAYSAARAQSRKTKLAQARAVAMAREMADTVVPRYKVDAERRTGPGRSCRRCDHLRPGHQSDPLGRERPEPALDCQHHQGDDRDGVPREQPGRVATGDDRSSDVFQASTTHLIRNDKVTADDLLHLVLIASDNAAARALARISPYGSEGFIRRMNEKAAELGLESTHYTDPSGLLSENVSSAYDMARLITHASQDERISSIMRTTEYTVFSGKRPITFRSTNHLLRRGDVDVRAGKTGFISKAGYCLATVLRLPQTGQDVAVVVFGARSNAGRFMESRNLMNWVNSKAATLFAAKPVVPVAQQQQQQ
jgi:D-alanyl-D-alanine endopeptidase (penicillin-binding protein 7)